GPREREVAVESQESEEAGSSAFEGESTREGRAGRGDRGMSWFEALEQKMAGAPSHLCPLTQGPSTPLSHNQKHMLEGSRCTSKRAGYARLAAALLTGRASEPASGRRSGIWRSPS
ncbi:hypothetical protein NHX12_022384, partial [Muraenolepis orangiensis]